MEAGWQADPSGRHQERWFDGTTWSSQVRDHGVVNDDPAGVPGGAPGAAGPTGPPPPPRSSTPGGVSFGRIGSVPASPPLGTPAPPSSAPPPPPAGYGSAIGGVPVAERVPAGTAPPMGGPALGGYVPPHPAPGGAPMPAGQGGIAVLGSNSIVSGLIAGALGGGIGNFFADAIQEDRLFFESNSEMNVYSGIWVALVGLILGALLASWDSITAQAWARAGKTAAIGALTGAVAGFAGGYLAQMLFTSMLENVDPFADPSEVETQFLLARGAGWGVFGAVLGLGLGIPVGGRKVVNGLVGGLIGGALGGVAFQLLANSATDIDSANTYRLIGVVLTGLGIGLGVGIVDRLTRQAWVQFQAGPLRGREVILYKPRTSFGGAPTCDVVLSNDPSMQPVHLVLSSTPGGVVAEPSGSVSVSGAPLAAPQVLRPGEVVEMGSSRFVVNERTVR